MRQLAVPTKLRHEIQLSYHDSKAGGCHMRIQKTYDSIMQTYCRPGMYQDIHKYISKCKTCQVTKRDMRTCQETNYASFAFTRCFLQVAHGYSCWLTKNKRTLSVHSSYD